ncbi:DUF6711 family protein [Anaeromassilibacillus senegalensis]|uniref:DUF6711 family protein n=1 Tax=Anaeromassilibacillus senegalensis TaxID=1673717 RepID=UPI000680407A|nr:DUF6711 family protein [Anaeromassilibacillus senegalensis]
MTLLKINGVEVEGLVSVEFGLQDLSSENSKRDLSGIMHKDVVAQKRTLNCKCGVLTLAQGSKLLKLLNGVTFNVTYPDLLDGKPEIRKFYVGDRTAPYFTTEDDTVFVNDLAFSLIEV